MVTLTILQYLTLALGGLAAGAISGIPIGVWIQSLPVRDQRRCLSPTPTCALAQRPDPAPGERSLHAHGRGQDQRPPGVREAAPRPTSPRA